MAGAGCIPRRHLSLGGHQHEILQPGVVWPGFDTLHMSSHVASIFEPIPAAPGVSKPSPIQVEPNAV